jgi:hypothetical protein
VARWGFKEVRESARTAIALLEAFPKGRVIFLTRHLASVLASYVVSDWYGENGGSERIASQWLESSTSFATCPDSRILHVK